MRVRLAAALAAACVLAAGCKKDPPQTAEVPPPVEQQAQAPAKTNEQPPVEQEPVKVQLTAEHVDRYANYAEALTPVALKFAEDARAAGQKGMTGMAELKAAKDRFDAESAALQKANGLSAAEVAELTEAIGLVVDARKLWNQSGGDKMIEEMKKAQARVPPEQKAELDEQVKNVEGGLKKMRDAEDARTQFGNDVVDAILKREDQLAAHREKVMRAALGAVQ